MSEASGAAGRAAPDGHTINRRGFLEGVTRAGAGIAMAVGTGSRGQPVRAESWVRGVLTTAGPVRAQRNHHSVYAFKGIPYGASTAGANRFMPPRKPEPWTEPRDATEWAGRAPQAPGARQRPEVVAAGLSGPLDTVPETEDCLVLNVWSGELGESVRRPVMVWFHGGAFSYGSANMPRLDGSNLVTKHGVVVVSVNQRLNILGHLHLAEIGGPEFERSGNAGTLDMLAALEWVRDNIARFGGDPGNVTIYGHSGGGGKVSTLLTMPAAKGLFHRAIIMSGAALRLATPERSARLAEAVLAELGLQKGQVRALQTMPFKQLIAAIGPAQKRLGPPPMPLLDRYDFGPVVDGRVVAAHPFDPVAAAVSPDVPVIVGGVKDEMAGYLAPEDAVWNRTLSAEELRDRVARVAGGGTERVLAAYARLYPDQNPAEQLITILTHSNFRLRTMLLAERRAALGKAPVWLYAFDWETPVLGGRMRAFHGLDVPFAFDTLDVVGATDRSEVARDLARRMSTTWATFARTGKPDNDTIPAWPAFTAKGGATLVLDRETRIVAGHNGEEHGLWKELLKVGS